MQYPESQTMRPDENLLSELSAAEEAREFAYARYLCERLLDLDPGHWPTLIRYASTLVEFCLYKEADEALDQAEAIIPIPKRRLIHAERGHLFDRMGDFDNAMQEYLKAHELDPNDTGYLIYAAGVAFRSGAIPQAEVLARRALTCSEGCLDEAYFNLGGFLLAQRRYREARECYVQALQIDPDYSSAKKRLADVDRVLAYSSKSDA